jgi:hypothetical protein
VNFCSAACREDAESGPGGGSRLLKTADQRAKLDDIDKYIAALQEALAEEEEEEGDEDLQAELAAQKKLRLKLRGELARM